MPVGKKSKKLAIVTFILEVQSSHRKLEISWNLARRVFLDLASNPSVNLFLSHSFPAAIKTAPWRCRSHTVSWLFLEDVCHHLFDVMLGKDERIGGRSVSSSVTCSGKANEAPAG